MSKPGLDFAAFFRSSHGVDPFPWQSRLAKLVTSSGRWPDLLDLPTGSGKTAAIDIAVFHLASQADQGARRTAPVRIIFVVDRRIVVDEAFQRALRVATALRAAASPGAMAVREALARMSGDAERPLAVTRLRGGLPGDPDWARSPAQPLVVLSTVDQAGSRLLFRGYGVSPRMRPVHAGLLGSDALWLLDEVHLAQPFAQTLDAIAGGPAARATEDRLAPFGVVRLSATSGQKGGNDFHLERADHEDPVLGPRLRARKPAHVETVKGDLPGELARRTLRLIEGPDARDPAVGGPTRIGVVLNHVGLARATFDRLRSALTPEMVDLTLLIGPCRPLDRDDLVASLKPFLASASRTGTAKRHVLVATQTIEVGADLDFDVLLTQVAPLDCLRQRFGRLDRLGRNGSAEAVILLPGSKEAWEPVERLYGEPSKSTAAWLTSRVPPVDFGVAAFDSLEFPDGLAALRADAPTFMPAYTRLWLATSPEPPCSPDPELFLHGPQVSADVQIVWRCDVGYEEEEWANASLTACPPSSLEAVSVPVWAAQAWLRGSGPPDVADLPQPGSEVDSESPETQRPYLTAEPAGGGEWQWRWRWPVDHPLRPGDLIVVPSGYGGCDGFGWSPETMSPVSDLGLRAHFLQRRRGAVRVTRETLADALDLEPDAHEVWGEIVRGLPQDTDWVARDVVNRILSVSGLPADWGAILRHMAGGVEVERRSDDPSAGFVVWSDKRLGPRVLERSTSWDEEAFVGNDAVTDDSGAWGGGPAVGLSDHLRHVEGQVAHFAEAAGIEPRIAALLRLAARFHDIGKAEPRYQADFRSKSELTRLDPELAAILAEGDEPLAKPGSRVRFSATPAGFRHEALSVALAARIPAIAALSPPDRNLVLWLIGTHHGYGRPFFPPVVDPASHTTTEVRIEEVAVAAAAADAPTRIDQGWFELVERLTERVGPWELARLEAFVRLADHAASAAESGDTSSSGALRDSS